MAKRRTDKTMAKRKKDKRTSKALHKKLQESHPLKVACGTRRVTQFKYVQIPVFLMSIKTVTCDSLQWNINVYFILKSSMKKSL
jgi:hypothetical protein